jgi:hypothetical protein
MSFSQEKSMLDFINNMTPIFPTCETAKNKSDCYKTNIGNLITNRLNEENTVKTIEIKKIEIELSIRTESNGKSTILKLITKDSLIKKIVTLALEKIPLVKPLYSETKSEFVASTQSFHITIQKSKFDNSFELNLPQKNNDLSLKPFPNIKLTKHIGFGNCKSNEMEKFENCFNNEFRIWLENNIEEISKENLKGQKATLKLTFDKKGNLKSSVISNSVQIKNELLKVLKIFPKVNPAESNKEKVNITYSVPISF